MNNINNKIKTDMSVDMIKLDDKSVKSASSKAIKESNFLINSYEISIYC